MSNLSNDAGQFNDWALVLKADYSDWLLCLLVLAALAAASLPFFGLRRERRRSRTFSLLLLRFAGLCSVLLIVLQPAVQLRETRNIPNRVAVMLDTSGSMTIPSRPGSPARIELARNFLAKFQPEAERRSGSFVFDYYTFSTQSQAATKDSVMQAPAEGAATDIATALRSIPVSGEGELGGIVLVSDGRNTEQDDSPPAGSQADAAYQPGAPVFSFGAGSEEGFKDISIAEIRTPDFAFVRNTLEVAAALNVTGYGSSVLPVTLKAGGEVVASKEVSVPGAGGRVEVKFQLTPLVIGKTVYTIEVPAYADETVQTNNSKSFSLKVIRDKIRALLICGAPSWDERFLRETLKENPNIDLISFFILCTPTDLQLVPQDELSLIPFPVDEIFAEKLHTFDLVIFQNFTYQPYHMYPHLGRVRDFVVENGGGFAMVGGSQSFSSGGYAGTPVEDILPVSLSGTSPFFTFGSWSSVPGSLVDEASFRARLTEAGATHPVMYLAKGAQGTELLLRNLPELAGINLSAGTKPGAVALLEHPFVRADSRNAPVVAVMETGKGRSMAILTDSLWFWGFPFAKSEAGGSQNPFKEFWSNAIRWLIQDPEFSQTAIASKAESPVPGEKAFVEVRALDSLYRPAAAARVSLRIVPERGEPFSLEAGADAEGRAQFEFVPRAAGVYRLSATVLRQDGSQSSESGSLVVAPASTELTEIAPDFAFLRSLSEASGGQFYELPLASVPAMKLTLPKSVKILRKKDIPVWNHWAVFAFACLWLALEWFLRRRWGYL